MVPNTGPNVLSKYTYEPPLSGIVEANSDLEIAPGNTTRAAKRNANQIPGPMIYAANDGKTKRPEPIIAASEMIITPIKFNDLSN